MKTTIYSPLVSFSLFVSFFIVPAVFAQEAPAARNQLAAALRYQPVQKGVEFDIPTEEEAKNCEINLYDGRRGFIIKNPQKVTIRLFIDVDGNGRVDQWSYYRNGIEVYRDVDSTGSGAADQFRWLNSAGSRCGLDTNDDRVIDYWKTISPEEVSQEIILALASRDEHRFLTACLSKEELDSLQLGKPMYESALRKLNNLKSGFAEAIQTLALPEDTRWYHLNAVMPGLIPAQEQGNKKDMLVYENAIVTVGTRGEMKQISLGTLVKLGDGNWRALDPPKPYDDSAYAYTFIPPTATMQGAPDAGSNEVVKLIQEVQELQDRIPTLPAAQRTEKHKEVFLRILKIIAMAVTNDDRQLWIKQLADSIMEATQRNEFPEGGEQLHALYESIREDGPDDVAAHVRHRQIMTDYYLDLYAGKDEIKSYTQWQENLENLAEQYGPTDAGIETMMQLASNREMNTRTAEEPVRWYTKVVEAAEGTPVAEKAKGAIRRLTSANKAIPFKANGLDGKVVDVASFRGKPLVLYFWDSRTADTLSEMDAAASKSGVQVVGVNLDHDAETMKRAVSQLKVKWPQIYMPGGLDSSPAVYWGIQMTPYMILYDNEGKVAQPNLHSPANLEQALTGE